MKAILGKGLAFLKGEWLFASAAAGLVLTSLYLGHFPLPSRREIEILFILFALFVAVEGLENSGLMVNGARRIERGRFVALRLVLATFLLSMIATNDVALVVIVPLTLKLDADRKDLLVILEALAANAGSALTPLGNPQNLFLYWFYHLEPVEFIFAIAPFSLFFLVLLVLASLCVKTGPLRNDAPCEKIAPSAWMFGGMLGIVILTVLHLLPVYAVFAVMAGAFFVDRKSLSIDYALLASFLCFFGVAENLKEILPVGLKHSGHVFLASALSSQFVSNVPAALLFAKFTLRWKALLWGANVGGFGSLVGSLANLIAYRLYVKEGNARGAAGFALRFLIAGYVAFFLGIGLYGLLSFVQ